MFKVVPVVCACIFLRDSILLQSREGESRLTEYFQTPGGKVEEGESLEEALFRELEEELGYKGFCSLRLIHTQINRYPQDPESYLCFYYQVIWDRGMRGIRHPIHWIPLNELDNYKTLPGTIEAIRKC